MNTTALCKFVFVPVLLCISNVVFSQSKGTVPDFKNYNYHLAILIGKGIHTGYQNPASYDYRPTLFLLEYQKRLSKKDKRFLLDYLLQPQVNAVRFKDSLLQGAQKEYTKSWEAGVNINLLLHVSLFHNAQKNRGAEVYLQGGSGPHYIHASPARQAKGFIFSDNIYFGFRTTLAQRLLFDVRGGLRHLSNASLKKPNYGLDNTVVGAGIRLLR